MMKSSVMKVVALGSWLLTALAAIGVGLSAFGYNVYGLGFMQRVVVPANYVLLGAGVVSLLMFFMSVSGNGCDCCGGAGHRGL